MQNLPRLIFYTTGTLLVSSAFTLFTTDLLQYIAGSGWIPILVILGFALVYMNITFVTCRRYLRRLQGVSKETYALAAAVGLPPVIWVHLYDAGLDTQVFIYNAVILLFVIAGMILGNKAGLKAQEKFRKELNEYLQQNHDSINKN